MKPKNLIGITTGDHLGIGPEIIAKGLHDCHKKQPAIYNKVIIFGLPQIYLPYKKWLPSTKQWNLIELSSLNLNKVNLKNNSLNFIYPSIKKVSSKQINSYCTGRYIELAVAMAQQKRISAITTGPIDKNQLQAGGFHFEGHTEFLKHLCKSPTVTMMLAGPKLRVVLVTTHLPLKKVASALTIEKIINCISNTIDGLQKIFNIKKPRLAVLALNPHASDQGLFGNEEEKIIIPAIAQAKRLFFKEKIDGPFAADGFFAQYNSKYAKEYDAVVCMYHDQGLIPVKLLDFQNTVNVTLGLPIIRTSVDHGVAYDIAGKNIADAVNFQSALNLAISLANRRK